MSSHLQRDEALEKEDRIDEMKKIKNSPPILHLLQAQQATTLPYAKAVGRLGAGSYPAPLPDPTTHYKVCTRVGFYEISCPQHMLVPKDNLETRLLYYTNCQSWEREIIQPNIYRILLKVNQAIHILDIICMPNIMVKAQGVLQIFC